MLFSGFVLQYKTYICGPFRVRLYATSFSLPLRLCRGIGTRVDVTQPPEIRHFRRMACFPPESLPVSPHFSTRSGNTRCHSTRLGKSANGARNTSKKWHFMTIIGHILQNWLPYGVGRILLV